MQKHEKIIYIHIGSPKTGTTSIQKFFTENNKKLFESGIFYPLQGKFWSDGLFINGECMNNRPEKDEDFRNVIREFEKSNCSKMVLSEELLFDVVIVDQENSSLNGLSLDKLKKLKQEGFQVKVVVYLRNSVAYLSGLWQEWLRHLANIGLYEYIKMKAPSYCDSLKQLYAISDIIGPENLIIRLFEPESLKNGSSVDDFIEVIGLEKSSDLKMQQSSNIGITRDLAEEYLLLNLYVEHDIFKKVTQHISKNSSGGMKILDSIPDYVIEEIVDLVYPTECELARNFFARDELFTQKYPAIYKKERAKYGGSNIEDMKFLSMAMSLQQIKNQNKIIAELSLLNAVVSKNSNSGVLQYIRKSLLGLICCFIPSKSARKRIRRFK